MESKRRIGRLTKSVLSDIVGMSLLESGIVTNEQMVVATIRAIFRAQMQYSARNATYGTLQQLIDQKILDDSLQTGVKAGYKFSIQNISDVHFEIIAVPQDIGKMGRKGFFVDETTVVRYSPDGSPPNSSSPSMEE